MSPVRFISFSFCTKAMVMGSATLEQLERVEFG